MFASRSNRTIVGLKLASRWWGASFSPRQQSHHCGIETKAQAQSRKAQARSNRTIVGLKPISGSKARGRGVGSNRTIVGLKPYYDCLTPPVAYYRSNRTIVGLKRSHCLHSHSCFCWQQSHHCGIETANLLVATQPLRGSNCTIVGLKLIGSFAYVVVIKWQQSHHCGIETNNTPLRPSGKPAAIAPLWD